MKRTDLEKLQGLKIQSRIKPFGAPLRPGEMPASTRREQRDRDRARGLVPFAVKIEASLAAALRDAAGARGVTLDDFVAEILRAGLKKG